MTNEQAKALAEKVNGTWAVSYLDGLYKIYIRRYDYGDWEELSRGYDWPSTFLAAGVEINVDCEYCPSKCNPELRCGWTYAGFGLGYRLLEPKGKQNGKE